MLFNIGFYAVVPFLALVLTEDFALGGAAVGLVLGVRTFSQQGMFLAGGMLADHLGAKAVILLGCAVRCAGFLTLSASLWGTEPALGWFVVGTVLTGLGGALFSPSLNTLVAAAELRREHRSNRRVTLFAWLTVVGEVGAAVGPLLGAALLGWGFAVVAGSGAVLFGLVGVVLWWRLPRAARTRRAGTDGQTQPTGRPAYKRAGGGALRDRRFVVFAIINAVDLLTYNQLYLSMPMELRRVGAGGVVLGLLFTWVSILTVTLQLPIAHWSSRFQASTALRMGYLSSACGFLVLAAAAPWPPVSGWELAPAFVAVTCFTLGHLLALPTALGVVTVFAGERPTGSYFGLLATAGGIAVLLGNVGVGSLLDFASTPQPAAALPWLVLAVITLAAALLVRLRWIWARPAT